MGVPTRLRGISQAIMLEWVAISYIQDLPEPGIKPSSLASHELAGRFFTTVPLGKAQGQATYILFFKASGCYFQRILDCVCVCMCLYLQLEPGGDQETFGSKGAFGFQHPVR